MYKISVIMPVYNVEEYLDETLESLINQTLDNFEVIFIDDGSTDSSKEILEKYVEKYDYMRLISQENNGPSHARNKGIKLAEGEYIAFMDSDDIIPKDSLEVRYKLATEHDAEIVVCGTYLYDGKQNWPISSHFLSEGIKNIRSSYDLLWTLGPCNKLFKTSLIKYSEFPEDIKYAEDQVFVMDAYLRANKVYASKYLAYYYRTRPDADSRSLTKLADNKTAYVIGQVMKSWQTTSKSIDVNCTNYYTAEKLKYEYFSRLVNVDIWPPFKNAIISKNEKLQLETIESMNELLDSIDSCVFNELEKLNWIVIQGVIERYLSLTKKARDKYLKLLTNAYNKLDSNSKNMIKVNKGYLLNYIEKAVKKQNPKYIMRYLIRKRLERTPEILINALGKRSRVIFRLAQILPTKKKLVILASNKSDTLSGNLKFINKELEKQEKYDIKLYMNQEERTLREKIEMYYNFGRAKYVVLDDYYRQLYKLKFKKNVEVVQVWHACGAFKRFGFSSIGKGDGNTRGFETNAHSMYTKVIASSKYIIPKYAEAFNIDAKKVLPLGVPRTDILLDEEYKVFTRRNFENLYPQIEGKKIITYAPTFRGNAKERQKFKLELKPAQILKKIPEDYIIILKLHPSVKNSLNDVIIPEELKDRLLDLDSSTDINDLIMISDIVITDYSSVVFEAALLDKKMIMYAYDKEDYLGERDFYYDYEEFVPGPIASTNEDIINIINSNEFNLDKIKEFKEKFFDHYDGKASERFVREIFKD